MPKTQTHPESVKSDSWATWALASSLGLAIAGALLIQSAWLAELPQRDAQASATLSKQMHKK